MVTASQRSRELADRRLDLFDTLLDEHGGRRQVRRVLERLVSQPNEVESHLVAPK